jgi:putative DNA primase/helicase
MSAAYTAIFTSGTGTAARIVHALGGCNGVCRCPVHDDIHPSLSISDGVGGNVIVNCFAGCDYRDIKDELRRRGFLPDWKLSDIDPKRRALSVLKQHHIAAEKTEFDRRRADWCRSIWNEAQDAQNSPVDTYLRSRGIDTLPPTIRYHAGLKHTNSGLYFPSMIAAVTKWPSKKLSGIHRTYLQHDGSGKAEVEPAKMMAGECAGGAVRLALAEETLAIGEGIETSISVLQSTNIPVWATLSTSGMRSVILPPQVRKVIICPDGDAAGEKAAREVAIRFKREGRSVHIARPPNGADFNDLLNSGKQDAEVGTA